MGEPGRRRLAEERLTHLEKSGEAWALLQEFHLAGGGGGEDAASRWAGIGEKQFSLVMGSGRARKPGGPKKNFSARPGPSPTFSSPTHH